MIPGSQGSKGIHVLYAKFCLLAISADAFRGVMAWGYMLPFELNTFSSPGRCGNQQLFCTIQAICCYCVLSNCCHVAAWIVSQWWCFREELWSTSTRFSAGHAHSNQRRLLTPQAVVFIRCNIHASRYGYFNMYTYIIDIIFHCKTNISINIAHQRLPAEILPLRHVDWDDNSCWRSNRW